MSAIVNNQVGNGQQAENTDPLHIDVKDLTFGYVGREPVLRHLNMQLTNGARCLLIGANGAGKSTILRILSGRHLTKPDGAVQILGRSSFHDTRLNFERSYLDTDWGMRTVAFAGYGCPLQADIPVFSMMEKLQAEYPERRDELIKLLGIDPRKFTLFILRDNSNVILSYNCCIRVLFTEWRMHQVSDGQRRRVQIFLGLIRPFKILLLDEVTVSLDVVVRQDLLRWLKRESETRGATILYATHIFDGLDDWPTHLHYLCNKGHTGWQGKVGELELYQQLRAKGEPSPLLRIAESWLRAEITELEARGEQREPAQGTAAQADLDPTQQSFLAGGGFSAGRMAAYDYIG